MKKYWRACGLCVLTIFLLVTAIPVTLSQGVISSIDQVGTVETREVVIQAQVATPTESQITPPSQHQGQNFPVVLDGEALFYFSSVIKGIPAENRAQQVSHAIEKAAKDYTISLDTFKIIDLEGIKLVAAGDNKLFTILQADARVTNRPLGKLANEYLQTTKDAIARYRIKHNRHQLLLKIGIVVIEAVLLLILLMVLLRKLARKIHQRIRTLKSTFRPLIIQNWQVFSVDQEANFVLTCASLLYWLTVAAIVFAYLSLLTFHLPQTQPWRQAVIKFLFDFINDFILRAIAYLPNLLTIILTIFIAYHVNHFSRLFFKAIQADKLSIKGFYPEWAKPTQRLVMVLIIALTMAIIFPLLPGAKSPAFRGISIFAGALFTLGGASTIANLVGGFIIIYTRAFQIGDRVQVDHIIGIILEKTILSTRIRTAKNEIVTIPNASLITSNIKNFTTTHREINQPLILHTVVTMGYDIPWRQVHQVLIEAALATPLILKEPTPFILQTGLGDFSVSYELNVYTNHSAKIPQIYSELHQNIQDKCNEAGMEILSPHYAALRDGNQNTMPEEYLPQGYQATGFRINPLNKIFNQPDD